MLIPDNLQSCRVNGEDFDPMLWHPAYMHMIAAIQRLDLSFPSPYSSGLWGYSTNHTQLDQ